MSENFIHFCAFSRVIVQGYHSIPEINRGSFRRLVSFQGQFVDRISGSGSFRALYTNAFSKGEALPIPSSSPIVCFLGLFVFFFFSQSKHTCQCRILRFIAHYTELIEYILTTLLFIPYYFWPSGP